ncbi:hypothetical protein HGB25_01245 [Candidatus Saccharibacteria bacterium]|nr:hypothetical protein [Candidatus Saccharibacteria bacterium]
MKKLTKQKIKKVVIAVGLWCVFWFGAQAIYLIPISPLNTLELPPNLNFLLYTIWILCVSCAGVFIWKKKVNDFSFLKVKNKKILYLYIMPIIMAIIFLIRGNGIDINRPLYIVAIASTTFIAQDMLTFGFLQTYLEKIISRKTAAMITCIAFFTAHLTFGWSLLTLTFLLGGALFSYLRYRTKNIYLLDIIHISFLLLPF